MNASQLYNIKKEKVPFPPEASSATDFPLRQNCPERWRNCLKWDFLTIYYILSDSCQKCGKSKWISAEVLRCLNYTPARLSADWLIPILHCWTSVVCYTLMYWLTVTGALSSGKFWIIVAIGLELVLLRGKLLPDFTPESFPAAFLASAKIFSKRFAEEASFSLLFGTFVLSKNVQ